MDDTVIKNDDYINCCPICGSDANNRIFSYPLSCCTDCKGYKQTTKQERQELNTTLRRIAITYTSQKPKQYYEKLSEKRFDDSSHWKEIFVEEELSQHPLFDRTKYEISCQKEKKRNEHLAYRKAHPEEFVPYSPPQPKCPTCGSTDIKRISDLSRGVHAFTFGLFSKTARSQFECNNCKYKW